MDATECHRNTAIGFSLVGSFTRAVFMRNSPILIQLCTKILIAGVLTFCIAKMAQAQVGTLAEPLPQPSTNAALHYQRALLLMSALDEADRSLLEKNVWEVIPGCRPKPGTAGRIKRLLYRSRHAADAAGKGSRLQSCDFGIDFADAGSATILPHVAPLVHLGRMLTLRGAYAQSQGNWEEAAVIYFDGLRLGRHLTRQPTLLEAMAGMQILENNYYALAHWAAACPDTNSVGRAFALFEIMADDLIRPARTLTFEATILAMDFDYLRRNYPNGAWGTAMLMALDGEAGEEEQENRKLAIKTCVDAGVPREVFDSAESFHKYLAGLQEIELRYAESAALCMALAPQARVRSSQHIYGRYSKAVGVIGRSNLLNAVDIGALFAGHEASITVLRVTLAVAGGRGDDGFPKTLDAIAGPFGGDLPKSPYDGSALTYEVFNEGQAFRVALEEVRVGDVVLPQVDFTSLAPANANQTIAKKSASNE
jgi:hypothetical protein